MMNLNDFPHLADSLRVGDLSFLEKIDTIDALSDIITIYVAPPSYTSLLASQIDEIKLNNPNLEILPFSGGFKLKSLLLFSLRSKEDVKYFNKITGFSLGKNGEMTSNS